jgi:DNA-binding NarL/FixJ family response regulator
MVVSTADEITVVIVDDHRMFSDGLVRLLADEIGITVVGAAATGAEGIDLVARLKPQVVLVDYQMPDTDGVAVASEIRRRDPTTMVVMLTGSTDDQLLLAAIEAGCAGFLTKDRAASEVAAAVRAAAVGESVIPAATLARLLPKLSRASRGLGRGRGLGSDLTEREREVLGFVARGWSNKAIASELYLSVNTIRNYVQYVLNKLGAHSKLEAVSTAVREGILSFPT